MISKGLLNSIGNPKTIQIATSQGSILIAKDFQIDSSENAKYVLKGNQNVVYSTELVVDIIQSFNLDFSNRTSYTLGKYKVEYLNGNKVAVVTL